MDLDDFSSSLERSLSDTISQREHLKELTDESISGIRIRTKFLHSYVDEIEKECIEHVLELQKNELARFDMLEDQLRKALNILISRSASQSLQSKLTMEDSDDVTDHKLPSELVISDDELAQLQKISELEHVCLNFKHGSVSKDDMRHFFGSVEYYHITLPSSISTELPNHTPKFSVKLLESFLCEEASPNIHALLPICASEAWICCGWGSKDVHLYNVTGAKEVSLTLDVGIDHVCMTSCGSLLVSSYNGTVIQKIDDNLQISTFAKLNFSPRGMAISDSRDIYVCGVEKISGSSEDNRHIIVKMSEEGEILSEVDVSPHDPHRIAVDSQGNLFFSDYNSSRREFVVMDASGKVKVIYQNCPDDSLDSPFYPLGVVRDRYGHILISDWNNDCIYLLDIDGSFARCLLTSEDGIECPNALGIDRGGRLWVGNGAGCVKIYQYIT